MNQLVVTADGDYNIIDDLGSNIMSSESTTVLILSNTASAVLFFGCADAAGNFVPYPNGSIATGNRIDHGKGAKLMVRVSGITAGQAVIGYFQGLK